MNTSSLPLPAAAPPPPAPPERPPLTRRQAERLLWREEWRAHARTLGIGAALWIWLYLVPGQTSQSGQLLGWSIAWAGVCALLIAGRDLRHGIDPLMRTLAPPHHLRWHMRAAIILLATVAFYTLSLFAVEGQWATNLWTPIANGPFVSNQYGSRAPFEPWQGLAVVSAVAMTAALTASFLHGVIFSASFAAILIVLATQLSGDYPGILAYLTPVGEMQAIGYEATTRSFGLAGLGITVAAWFAGAVIARRRPVITTHSSTAEVQAATAGLAFSLLAVVVALFAARMILGGHSSDRLTWVVFLPTATSMLLAVWWAHIWRTQKSHSPPSRWSNKVAAIISLLAAAHIGLHLWHVFYLPVPPLREKWPAVMENPKVHTGLTVLEASQRRGASGKPASLDLFLFTHFDTAFDYPFTLRSYTVEVPPPGEFRYVDVELPLPGSPEAVYKSRIEITAPDPAQKSYNANITAILSPRDSTLSPAAEALSYNTASEGYPLIFSQQLFDRNNLSLAQKTAGLPLTCRLLVLPRPPGQPSRELSWADTVEGMNLNWSSHDAFNVRKPSGIGVKGLLGNELAGLFWLGIPILVFGSFAHYYCRNWPWVLLGAAVALLLGAIGIDGLRQKNLQRIASDEHLPPPQRHLAGAWLRNSYFHQAKKF